MQNDAETTEATKAAKPAKDRRGAPLGNANRVVHGLRGVLTLSRGPKGSKHSYRLVARFRAALHAEAIQRHGKLSLHLEGLITSACRCEIAIKLLEAWARKTERTDQERLQAVRQAADLSERRDRIVERLGLGGGKQGATGSIDPWAALDAHLNASQFAPAASEGAETTETTSPTQNATDATLDAIEARHDETP